MTEEEKEATENLNKLVQQRKDKTNTITIKYDSCICSTKELDIALNLIQRQEEENIKLKQENEKKDEIIDAMVNSFAEEGFYSEHCQTLIDNDICTDDCNKCVKKFFERKVEDERS